MDFLFFFFFYQRGRRNGRRKYPWKCTFTFHTTNILGCFCGVMAHFELVKHNFLNQTMLFFIGIFSNHTQNEEMYNVSTPTTTILLTTLGTFYSLNCFSHMIYTPKTSMYNNIGLNFSLMHNSQSITIPTPSCLHLSYFCVSLLHSLMWFDCHLITFTYNFYLISVLMALFCTAFKLDSVISLE